MRIPEHPAGQRKVQELTNPIQTLKHRKTNWGSLPRRLPRIEVELSCFRAVPGARLSHLPFESYGDFQAQC